MTSKAHEHQWIKQTSNFINNLILWIAYAVPLGCEFKRLIYTFGKEDSLLFQGISLVKYSHSFASNEVTGQLQHWQMYFESLGTEMEDI